MELVKQLEVERLEVNLFRGINPRGWQSPRVFGGLVAAQSLRAACATIKAEHHPHSLHGYFLRPGERGHPIVYRVEQVRDGGSFSTRTVFAIQHGEVVFTLTASFHRFEPGAEYQLPVPRDLPDPDSLPEYGIKPYGRVDPTSPFERRDLGPDGPDERGIYRASRRTWLRAKKALPDDPIVHVCALTYATDMGGVSSAAVPIGMSHWQDPKMYQQGQSASLDHAVWIHRQPKADEWLYYELEPVANQGARGLVRGNVFDREGRVIASVAQEALLRVPQ